jgi:hypothetical protein
MRESASRGPASAPDEDVCPYQKPFPPGFHDCPAFTPVDFVPVDLRSRPLPPVLSCAHLMAALRDGQPGRLFPACRLGSADDRVRWAKEHLPGDRPDGRG